MSEPGVAVTIVDYNDGPSGEIIAQAVFDTPMAAVAAVHVLLRFWSFDADSGRRIELQRA